MQPIIAAIAVGSLAYRAWSHKSLTPVGILTALLTAIAHAVHPSPLPFALLAVFFVVGTKATKVKHDVKSRLTISQGGSGGGEGPRTHIQVLANSGVASALSLLHTWKLWRDGREFSCIRFGSSDDILMLGIIANYAAVAADTLSSELGILSPSQPRLITSLKLRKVPRGTNGAITATGVLAGSLGAFAIGLTTVMLIGPCPFGTQVDKDGLPTFRGSEIWKAQLLSLTLITIWGTLGSLLDSILGGIFQASIVDKKTGKIIEGSGGRKISLQPAQVDAGESTSPPRDVNQTLVAMEDGSQRARVAAGADILDNNQVNLLMAASMSFAAIITASWLWEIPLREIVA